MGITQKHIEINPMELRALILSETKIAAERSVSMQTAKKLGDMLLLEDHELREAIGGLIHELLAVAQCGG